MSSMISTIYNLVVDPITWVNYVPAAVYLACVCGVILSGRVWLKMHPILFAAGFTARLIMEGPVAFVSFGFAAFIFVACVWALSKTISATGVFTLCIMFGLLPLNGWHAAGLGLGLALVVAVVNTSMARTKQIGAASMMSLGLTPYGVGIPHLNHLPQRSADGNGHRTVLPPFFLTGVLTVMGLTWWLG